MERKFQSENYPTKPNKGNMKYMTIFLALIISITLFAQSQEYIGGEFIEGVTVSSSSNFSTTEALNTINGNGLDAKRMEASRFLAQSTLGFNETQIQDVMNLGIESWLDQQIALPVTHLTPVHNDIFATAKANYDANKEADDEEYFGPWGLHFNYAWWQVNMTNDDLIRHRIAFALSEILVISMNSDLQDFGEGLSDYYDMLLDHAFGNYEDLLVSVSLHPCMGYYLSHMSNPQTNLEENIHPDENYAREIMQLFTIGLYMLNSDGTRQLDNESNFIPTYDNHDIKEMAKVFTGLSGNSWSAEALMYFEMEGITNPPPVTFGEGIYQYSRTDPMKMYENQHEAGSKTILKSNVIPNGQTGMKDVLDAISILFNHDNTGPFIGTRLIQRLVKSNPSPEYVNRVTQVFNDNGNGVRGDLKAVISAILMDEEARTCEWQQDPYHGMLREPIIRYMHFARAIDNDSPMNYYWNNGFSFRENAKQLPMASPTVFNFFLPDYQPVGEFTTQGIFGPEFQIHNTQTSAGFINQVNQWTLWETLFWSWEEYGEQLNVDAIHTDFTKLGQIAEDTEELINYLDNIFTHGRMSDDTRQIIRNALAPLIYPGANELQARIALYLTIISPDYAILK